MCVCACRGPLNEDVFAAWNKAEVPVMHEDVKELQAMIYKLFLQVSTHTHTTKRDTIQDMQVSQVGFFLLRHCNMIRM